MGVIPWSPLAGGWLSGKYRRGQALPTDGRARLQPQRFDPSTPDNARRLDLVEELDKLASEAGTTLVELAVAFVLEHPAVTSAIIGPRTWEQLTTQLGAADIALDTAVLDRIDELVPPGTNLNQADTGWTPPAIAQAWRRRRTRRD